MRKSAIFIILIMALFMVGCSGDDSGESNNNNQVVNSTEDDSNANDSDKESETQENSVNDESDKNFAFKSKGIIIAIDDQAEGILKQLGDPMEYFEAPSCAYQGLDKTYYYNGFEVTTYTDQEVDYIASVLLVDDTVTTDKGVYIGSSVDDVVEAYGGDFEETTGQYTYSKGDSELQFIFKDDLVVSIMYMKII